MTVFKVFRAGEFTKGHGLFDVVEVQQETMGALCDAMVLGPVACSRLITQQDPYERNVMIVVDREPFALCSAGVARIIVPTYRYVE